MKWLFFYRKKLIIQTVVNPVKARIVVIIVHDLKVSFSVILRYWPTSQKPLSLTCEKILAPDAMAITKQANCAFPKFIFTKRGAISPAAVIIATVDDPCMILTIAALIKANASTGNPASLNEVASNSPAPVVVKLV